MTTEEPNIQLYQRMAAEQEQYLAELHKMPPIKILDHVEEYLSRENILHLFAYKRLHPARAKALLKSNTPLADIYAKWNSWEHTKEQEAIWTAVEAHSSEVLRAEFAATQRTERQGFPWAMYHRSRLQGPERWIC